MEWTFANLLIQTVAGLVGSNIAATAAHEHRFGFWGHSFAGLASGGLGGLFLQRYASTVVTASGSLNEPIYIQIFASEALTGGVIGAIATMAVGFIINERAKSD